MENNKIKSVNDLFEEVWDAEMAELADVIVGDDKKITREDKPHGFMRFNGGRITYVIWGSITMWKVVLVTIIVILILFGGPGGVEEVAEILRK